MSEIVEYLKWGVANPIALAVITISVAAITAARLYFRGGVCRVSRDLTGMVVVITGGSAGIGKQTVKELASKGCMIIFGARDREKSLRVVDQVKKIHKNCNIIFFFLDLADKKSIEQFSQRVKESCEKVDILINNAGLTMPDRRVTKDGFEMTMGVNHLGHFYLTYLLWDFIKRSQRPRIITVSSILAHQIPKNMKGDLIIDFNDFNDQHKYDRSLAYNKSKLANILFSKELQARMGKADIKGLSLSLHPGVIMTEITREFGIVIPILKVLFWPLIAVCTKSVFQGAQTTLYLALEDQNKLQKGGFYGDCKLSKRTCKASENMEYARQLWEVSEKMLGIKFDI